MKSEDFLSRCQKVKRTSRDSWIACCPAHEDKNPSMTVKETADTFLIHCFAGCDINSILGAVGMDVSDLYPDTDHVKTTRISTADALRCLSFEAMVVVASAGTMRQRELSGAEMDRLVLASSRIQAALEITGVR